MLPNMIASTPPPTAYPRMAELETSTPSVESGPVGTVCTAIVALRSCDAVVVVVALPVSVGRMSIVVAVPMVVPLKPVPGSVVGGASTGGGFSGVSTL